MRIAAIIAEYNPFHNGHKYQLEKIRELLGDDTAIISIMSGNYTQRGELAIADKTVRARAAVDCGVNLVLELPFPYSMSSAEFFAAAGVHIASKLGVVDYLVFGSESGSAEELSAVAENMLNDSFNSKLAELSGNEEYKAAGYPAICEAAYRSLYKSDIEKDFFSPNNILAIEYIKALRVEGASIIPLTVKRDGAGYSNKQIVEHKNQSATAIRELIAKNDSTAFDYIPENAKTTFSQAAEAGKMPSDISRLDTAVISFFRLNPPSDTVNIHDAAGGLYNRLCDMSAEAESISSLTSMTETKKYTKARIRRAILYSYFGVTSSDVRALPEYTQVLAADIIGRELLRRIKKVSDFTVITKPSAYRLCSPAVIAQKELANRADSVFGLTLKSTNSGRFPNTFTPYVKK